LLLTDDGYDVSGKAIINVATPTNDTDAANKEYVDDQISSINTSIEGIEDALEGYLKLDGTSTMTGDLQMGSKKITGLADGEANTDAVTLGQLNAVKSDLEDLVGSVGTVMNFLGATYTKPTSSEVTLVGGTAAVEADAGDVVIVVENPDANSNPDAGKEFIYTGEEWIKIGDENGLDGLKTEVAGHTEQLTWKTF
jgi:hypothetical protein